MVGIPFEPFCKLSCEIRAAVRTQGEQESFSSGLLAGAGQVVTVDNINPALPEGR